MGTQENVPKSYPCGYNDAHHPKRESASTLFVYSRHAPECAHKDEIKYRRCRCPKWIDGYLDGKRSDSPPRLGAGNKRSARRDCWKKPPIQRSRLSRS